MKPGKAFLSLLLVLSVLFSVTKTGFAQAPSVPQQSTPKSNITSSLNADARLDKAKTRAIIAIDRKITAFNQLSSRIDADSKLTEEQKTALKVKIQAAVDLFNDLKSKIQDAQTIGEFIKVIQDFIRQLLQNSNKGHLASAYAMQLTVNNLKLQGADTAQLQSALDQVKNNLTQQQKLTDQLGSGILNATTPDQAIQLLQQSGQVFQIIRELRASLNQLWQELKQEFRDMRLRHPSLFPTSGQPKPTCIPRPKCLDASPPSCRLNIPDNLYCPKISLRPSVILPPGCRPCPVATINGVCPAGGSVPPGGWCPPNVTPKVSFIPPPISLRPTVTLSPGTCFDSDGGNYPTKPGYVTKDGGATKKVDNCGFYGEVNEWYCVNNNFATKAHICTTSCTTNQIGGYCDAIPTKTPTRIPSSTVSNPPQSSPAPFISLSSVAINGSNVTVSYSKNFVTCAHLLNASTNVILHTQNHYCASGNQTITKDISLFNSAVKAGLSVKLCHGNNYSLCSAARTITSPTFSNPPLTPKPGIVNFFDTAKNFILNLF